VIYLKIIFSWGIFGMVYMILRNAYYGMPSVFEARYPLQGLITVFMMFGILYGLPTCLIYWLIFS